LSSAAQYLYQEDLYTIPSPVLVVIPRPWHNILDSEKALLAKILGSVKVNIDSVTIVFLERVSVDSVSAFKPRRILVFGSKFSEGINPYEHVVLNNVSVICADDFSLLDDGKKKSLWIALKQMFGV
jgi:hypothetical protein